MKSYIQHHKTGISFITLLVLLLSLIASQVQAPDHPAVLVWAIYGIVAPVQQAVAYSIIGVQDIWNGYVDLRSTHAENKVLRDKLRQLDAENKQLKETLALAGGIQELSVYQLLLDQKGNYKTITAMIIGAGIEASGQNVWLNRGSLDGIEVDQGVIAPAGVVGKVIRVGPSTCLVQLLTDPRFAMASRVQSTRVRGIVYGTGNETVELKYIRDTDSIQVGDAVVSSGLEKIFPRGLLIGRINSVETDAPPFRRILVAPATDFRSLEWVLIVQGVEPQSGGGDR